MASKRIFNWILDVIGVACVVFVVWHYYFPSAPRTGDYTGLVGSKVNLRDITWSDSPRTVVLVLSTQCQFCKMSAEFYRALIDSARPDRFRVVVALRQSAQDPSPYLTELGVEKAKDIRETDLGAMGVRLTPTVMVVDRRGVVEKAWAGKLGAPLEGDVFAAVSTKPPSEISRVAPRDDSMTRVKADELLGLLMDKNTIVVDVRERSRFYEAHIPGSLNMPLDEIVPRAPHELPGDRTILIYCLEYVPRGHQVQESRFSDFECEAARRGLEYVGITKFRPIADDLAKLAQAGIRVEGKPHPETRDDQSPGRTEPVADRR